MELFSLARYMYNEIVRFKKKDYSEGEAQTKKVGASLLPRRRKCAERASVHEHWN